jgi:hypothetical protein
MPAACVKRLAKHPIAFERSDMPMFRSLTESNMMLSWRGITAGARIVGSGFSELLILLLHGDSKITKGASPQSFEQSKKLWMGVDTNFDGKFERPVVA